MDSIVNTVVSFFDLIHWWFTDGAQMMLSHFVIFIGKYMVLAAISTKIMMLSLGVSIAQSVMGDLHITQSIDAAYGALDARTVSMLAFFGVPTALQNVVTAFFTRFVLGVLGW